MTDFLLIGEIDSRRRDLRVEAKDLYRGAGVSQPTWNRALAGADISTGALRKLTTELVRIERETLVRLVALHPSLAAELVAAQPTSSNSRAKASEDETGAATDGPVPGGLASRPSEGGGSLAPNPEAGEAA